MAIRTGLVKRTTRMPPLHHDGFFTAPPLVPSNASAPESTNPNPKPAGPPSLHDLVEAYQEPGRPRFRELRAEFEAAHGSISQEYFAPTGAVAAVLLRHRCRRIWPCRYQTVVTYDESAANSSIGEALRRLQHEERQAVLQLAGGEHQILCHALFNLTVSLLAALQPAPGTRPGATGHAGRVDQSVKSVKKELAELTSFIQRSARRTALGRYLLGCLPGALFGCALVWLTAHSPTMQKIIDGHPLPICLATGAIGAVISVMTRVARGERIRVDSDKGKVVTVLAGSCRPVVGAVFGGALYVFIYAGIIPLTLPPSDKAVFYYAGLAFLAGFSERWAQDTIVGSAPKTA